MMDRDDENEGGSSPDTVIECAFVNDDSDSMRALSNETESNASLEMLTSAMEAAGVGGLGASSSNPIEEKKKKRFGSLKSTFRRDSFFKNKKKTKSVELTPSMEIEFYEDESAKEPARIAPVVIQEKRYSPVIQPSPSPPVTKMMKKRKGSIVRKLSLNKFRLGSSDQEARQTPEGGDSSRSQSQSSQDSPVHNDYTSVNKSGKKMIDDRGKGRDKRAIPAATPTSERRNPGTTWGIAEKEKGVVVGGSGGGERADPKARHRATDKLKTVSTVTVVQKKSPSSLTIRHNFQDRKDSRKEERPEPSGSQLVSTLPYAIAKWPETPVEPPRTTVKKPKLSIKSESESSIIRITPPPTPPSELRRKLSLLEEKRAIFQRKYFESSERFASGDTVVAHRDQSIKPGVDKSEEEEEDEEDEASDKLPDNLAGRRPSRTITVRGFDIFSTLEGEFDEESVDYLDQTTNSVDFDYPPKGHTSMSETSEAPRRLSADSGSTHNSPPTATVGEKREHLYKILVIGELGAGKTSIIKRYVHQFFSQHYRATIGVDFALKVLNWDPHTIIRLQLWDIAGQERFGNMTRVYYKEAVGAFIVFDVTRSATLDAVVKWKQDLDSKVQLPDGSPIPCVLLANKCDQQKEGLVNSPGKMDDYCNEKGFAGWFETSAKENINIEEAARFLVNKILQNDQIMKGNGAQDQADGERFALNQSPTSSKKSCSC